MNTSTTGRVGADTAFNLVHGANKAGSRLGAGSEPVDRFPASRRSDGRRVYTRRRSGPAQADQAFTFTDPGLPGTSALAWPQDRGRPGLYGGPMGLAVRTGHFVPGGRPGPLPSPDNRRPSALKLTYFRLNLEFINQSAVIRFRGGRSV